MRRLPACLPACLCVESQPAAARLQSLALLPGFDLPQTWPAHRSTAPSPPLALAADADEATALQDFMLAALRSFVRRYNVQCAELAERIGADILGGEGVPQELRAAVEAQLNL